MAIGGYLASWVTAACPVLRVSRPGRGHWAVLRSEEQHPDAGGGISALATGTHHHGKAAKRPDNEMNKNTLRPSRRLVAGILGLSLFAAGSNVAYAAPGTPAVIASAGQTSALSQSLMVTTTATINPGDLVVIAVSSEANQAPTTPICQCPLSFSGVYPGGYGLTPAFTGASPSVRAATFYSYATNTIAIGTSFQILFGGAVGAKSATIIAIPGAQISDTIVYGGASGASGSISPGATPSIPAGQLVLATSFVSGGGSDSYTEDAGFTFLHQTSAGAWPAIRVAYKLTSGSGAVSYILTDSTSPRTWISSYQIAK